MAATVSLAHMVDLALGTPEVGAVNFNVLHALLHAMLSKLNLSAVMAEMSKEDSDLLASDSGRGTTIISDGDSADAKDGTTEIEKGTPTASTGVVGGRTPYHVLQKKVASLEEQMEKLNQLPSNPDLFERAKPVGDGERPRPISDMWQNVQIKNRVDANEEGIGKLMSLVEDLMGEMAKLKDDSANLRKDLENHNIPGLRSDVDDLKKKLEELDIDALRDFMAKLKKELDELTNKMNDMTDMDELRKRLKDLENLTNDLNDRLSAYPPIEKFEDFVTWSALEEALKGLRDELEPKDKIVIEMQTQTSRPSSAKNGPSEELKAMLEKLGILTGRHEALDGRVVKLEEEMPNKADKSDLDGLSSGPTGIPDDLVNQLKHLQDQLKALSKAREKDSEALTRMQQIVLQLQAELDRIGTTAQGLIDDNNNKTKQIDNLIVSNEKLERVKADKEYVQSEVDVKADKRLVENKVNRSLFDQTTDELNRLIKEMLDKLSGQEDIWKSALGDINEDVDGKLDRLEFGPIRDELERRLRALARQLKELSLRDGDIEDDAAGIKKQLLRFNCISCDRAVDMTQHGPIPSIPAPGCLPATRSSRPYTTFELEQIRQHARSTLQKGLRNASNFERAVLERQFVRCRMHNGGITFITDPTNYGVFEIQNREQNANPEPPYEGNHLQQPGVEVVDLYATSRACGGSHTMTHPHRRITRVTQYNNLFRDEGEAPPSTKEELDIQGADGHIYKGRLDARLPTTLQQSAPNMTGPQPSSQPPKMSRVVYHQPVPRPPQTAPAGSQSQRPTSARTIKPMPSVPTADGPAPRPTSPPN